ncbi:MAG: hypothetical protein L6Q77_06995 [Bacteroidetes bacterium]|nr:hypothetical protein [Bacteroidota bacterium]
MTKNFKIHLVSYEDVHSWVLGKFALKMQEVLLANGYKASISMMPDPHADVNHHIHYFFYKPDHQRTGIETLMITHVDSKGKSEKLKKQIAGADMGICMSEDTLRLIEEEGNPRAKLAFADPAHDQIIQIKPTTIGLASRIYSDGRKREYLIENLLEKISPKDFSWVIMGGGWEKVVDKMNRLGFSVIWHENFDLKIYTEMIPALDYYLYPGLDEGQIGVIDALYAGVKVITTPQGYHLDVKDQIEYFFTTENELQSIFNTISVQKKSRRQAVQNWSWETYTLKHLEIWTYLLAKKNNLPLPSPGFPEPDGLRSVQEFAGPGLQTSGIEKLLRKKNIFLNRIQYSINNKRKFRFLQPAIRFTRKFL